MDAVATADAATGESALFLVNRSQTEADRRHHQRRRPQRHVDHEAVTLHDEDVYAKNTLHDQNRVGLKVLDGAVLDEGTLTVTLPPGVLVRRRPRIKPAHPGSNRSAACRPVGWQAAALSATKPIRD